MVGQPEVVQDASRRRLRLGRRDGEPDAGGAQVGQQPVDPVELWDSPPFDATVRDGEIYARGSADESAASTRARLGSSPSKAPPLTW